MDNVQLSSKKFGNKKETTMKQPTTVSASLAYLFACW